MMERLEYDKYMSLRNKYETIYNRLSNIRLFLFIIMIISFILKYYYYKYFFNILFILTLISFIFIVIVSNKYFKIYDYYLKYVEVIDKYLAREDGRWKNSKDKGEEFISSNVNYLKDLDIIGDNSLYQYLSMCETLGGREKLFLKLSNLEISKDELKERLAKSQRLLSGEEEIKLKLTGEEGVKQMRAFLGLGDFVTNVNLPNKGQIPNLPLGAVVETNASFTSGTVTPVVAGEIPKEIYPLISRICTQQEFLSDAIAERNTDKIFQVFANDPLVTCSLNDAKELFCKMINNTKAYLTDYDSVQ